MPQNQSGESSYESSRKSHSGSGGAYKTVRNDSPKKSDEVQVKRGASGVKEAERTQAQKLQSEQGIAQQLKRNLETDKSSLSTLQSKVAETRTQESGLNRHGNPPKYGCTEDSGLVHDKKPTNFQFMDDGSWQGPNLSLCFQNSRFTSNGMSVDSSHNRASDSYPSMKSTKSRDSMLSEAGRGNKPEKEMGRQRRKYSKGPKFNSDCRIKSPTFTQNMKDDNAKKESGGNNSLLSDNGSQDAPTEVKTSKSRSRKRYQHQKFKKSGKECVKEGQNMKQQKHFEEDKKEVSMPVACTKAELTVRGSFKDAGSFREIIMQHMPDQGSTEYKFLEESVLCNENDSFCTIIVQTESKQFVESFIENLRKNLETSLKKKVYYMISNLDAEEHETLTAWFASQGAKQIQDKVTRLPGEYSDSEVSSYCSPSFHKDNGFKSETRIDQKSNTAKQHPDKIRTTVMVTVGRVYQKTEDVQDFLNKAIGANSPLFEVVPESVVARSSKTLCKLSVVSKADARRISKKLNSSIFEDVKCLCHVVNSAENRDVGSSEDYMKKKLEGSMDEINRKASGILRTHRSKTQGYKQSHDALKYTIKVCLENQTDFEEVQNEALTLQDKLIEAEKQEKEFQSCIDDLKAKIKQMDPLSVTAKDLTLVLQNVGVECRHLETALPMYARRKDIVKQVTSNQVSIILGETGSGKSTQMAQYLYDAGLAGEGQIACTQPRKVAAITLAERVANEMATKVGTVVGYKTGIKRKCSRDTRIVFLTDHSLLNECLQDPKLTNYSCIIVDEAHERSIYTDLLLGMIKACLPDRPDLKVIITSATIDPEIFIKYFNSGPELQVSGRAFPVDVIYDNTDGSQDFENFESKAVDKAVEIHKNEDPGDILVFLTSSIEIMRCCEEFEKRLLGQSNFRCFPLHGQLPPDEQKKVFERLPLGTRKIVFATNCAETSITIDGIKYVIDTGVAKEMRYDPKKNIYVLGTHVISMSSADQRKGRAGRTASGKCFRLYSEDSYDSMDPISKPEILRVHLGQAVLKLAELGVDVKKYDFVQPPSEDAIDSALSNLQELGALSGSNITDIGRWISKLPFDPRQGFLVFQGNKENLLYDTVVLASLISHGSNLFYKGLNESEEQRSARSKNLFGSPYGDIFTWMEVYKTWCHLPNKERSKWCRENCINYKVLSFTKQSIDEVATILTKELKTKLEHIFSNDESALTTMRKMIFDANMSSVCHFLGHSRAGYYAAVVDRQVHFHPSSCLVAQNSLPEWVVYTEFTKTSRDFIKGITVVEEQWIKDATEQGKLTLEMMDIRKKRIQLVHREEAGSVLFRKLVGPRFSKVREMEESLAKVGMATVVVEADRDLGTLDVFSSSPMNQKIVQHLKMTKKDVFETLKSDEGEIAIKSSPGREQCGFRAALGPGGSVKALFMPDQSNKILIRKSRHSTTKETITKKFETFGDIKECVRFKCPDPWGFIRYDSYAQALAAAQATGKDEENAAVLKVDDRSMRTKSRFEAKLSWCRRPIKGNGTAFINVLDDYDRASLIGQQIIVAGNVCQIRESKKEGNKDLICFNTGQAQEDQIKQRVMDLLYYHQSKKNSLKITVLREKAHTLSKQEINDIKAYLSQYFMRFVKEDKFYLTLNPARESAFFQVAFIHFDNLLDGFHACKRLKNRLYVDGQIVEISPKLKTNVIVRKNIYGVCKDRLPEIISGLKMYRNTEVNVRKLNNDDFSIDIQSEEAENIVQARDLFQKELEGEVINCGANQLLKILLKPQSKELLLKIQEETKVLIIVDERKEELCIYGTVKSTTEAKIHLNKYLDQLDDCEPVSFFLKGAEKPPGLMRALFGEFESLHDDLVQRFGLTDVVIDFKKQKLLLLGSKNAVEKTCAFFLEVQNKLTLQNFQSQEKGIPDCVVCMCPVDNKTELYRLEGCGHSYCLHCLRLQVTVSVNDKNFPIVCAREDCDVPLVWKDFCMFLRKKWILEEKLVQMAVNSFVTKNSQKYKFCKTPNCPVVYKITDDKEGSEFNCPSCSTSICTSCHTVYHAGLTCKMAAKQTEFDRLAEEWIKANPSKRKHCPGCHGGVEKTEGCNKMHCTCGAYFCWLCLAIFEDEQDCYRHLKKKHGGFN